MKEITIDDVLRSHDTQPGMFEFLTFLIDELKYREADPMLIHRCSVKLKSVTNHYYDNVDILMQNEKTGKITYDNFMRLIVVLNELSLIKEVNVNTLSSEKRPALMSDTYYDLLNHWFSRVDRSYNTTTDFTTYTRFKEVYYTLAHYGLLSSELFLEPYRVLIREFETNILHKYDTVLMELFPGLTYKHYRKRRVYGMNVTSGDVKKDESLARLLDKCGSIDSMSIFGYPNTSYWERLLTKEDMLSLPQFGMMSHALRAVSIESEPKLSVMLMKSQYRNLIAFKNGLEKKYTLDLLISIAHKFYSKGYTEVFDEMKKYDILQQSTFVQIRDSLANPSTKEDILNGAIAYIKKEALLSNISVEEFKVVLNCLKKEKEV